MGQDVVACRVLEVDDHGQRVVVDLHGADRVPGRVAALGHHHGHGVADEAGLADRHREVLGGDHVLGHGPGARERAHAQLDELGAGVDGDDAGHARGLAGVDAADAGMAERAADDAQPEGAGDLEVIDEAGLAG